MNDPVEDAAPLSGRCPVILKTDMTHLANKGVSPYALQAFARHANMRTTLKYYVHLDKAALADVAVAALNAAPTKRGNGKSPRGKARGNDLAIAGNSPEFIARMMN